MFLPVTFILYALVRQNTIRNVILAAASLVFYAYGEPVAVMIMIVSIILNYLFGLAASGTKHDRTAVLLAVILNIGLLVAYKYTGFFAEIFNQITGLGIPVPHIRLPIGISFFTFQGLSYVIDVYRDKKNVQRSLFSVLLYISFFPQLIAGPIVRYQDIADRLHDREFTADRISRGICRFIFGLSKKLLIANQMGYVADMVFGMNPQDVGMGQAWIGAVFYSLQVFFDSRDTATWPSVSAASSASISRRTSTILSSRRIFRISGEDGIYPCPLGSRNTFTFLWGAAGKEN